MTRDQLSCLVILGAAFAIEALYYRLRRAPAPPAPPAQAPDAPIDPGTPPEEVAEVLAEAERCHAEHAALPRESLHHQSGDVRHSSFDVHQRRRAVLHHAVRIFHQRGLPAPARLHDHISRRIK